MLPTGFPSEGNIVLKLLLCVPDEVIELALAFFEVYPPDRSDQSARFKTRSDQFVELFPTQILNDHLTQIRPLRHFLRMPDTIPHVLAGFALDTLDLPDYEIVDTELGFDSLVEIDAGNLHQMVPI